MRVSMLVTFTRPSRDLVGTASLLRTMVDRHRETTVVTATGGGGGGGQLESLCPSEWI